MSPRHRILWIEDFVVVDANLPTRLALRQIRAAGKPWIVISRDDGAYLYAFTFEELATWPALERARETLPDWLGSPLEVVLDLHEQFQSTKSEDREQVPPIDRSWREDFTAPTISRYVQLAADQTPAAIGYLTAARRKRRFGPAGPPPAAGPPTQPDDVDTADVFEAARGDEGPGLESAAAPEATTAPVLEDEGTTPVRYPSIESDGALVPNQPVTVTVDLTFTPQDHTHGGAVDLGEQPADWRKLALTVVVSSQAVDFDGDGRGGITVRRNAASEPATITGRVRAVTAAGAEAAIVATFFHGTRFCGSALRLFTIAGGPQAPAPAPAAAPPTRGMVVPQPLAAQPDVTVRIFKDQPNVLSWLVQTPIVAGLPAKLRATVTFGRDVETEVSELFARFAVVPPGAHVTRIEAFGSELWTRTPEMFRKAYWALWDHYRRPLTIQFITNEPHLPWELMRPAREDDSEIHPPLALQHPVARWLEDYEGYMRNQVPAGGVFTIAPKYATVSLQLPRAQAESQRLMQHFGARAVAGTRGAVLALLETLPPDAPVALLHFAGHGQFVATAVTESNIKLEDGLLTAGEVKRPEVRLGRACRTLVFFNACEVGAAGTLFGEVGGWAAAFLSRQFGGFIAPLWSVEDEDAGVVADELLEGIVTGHQPIGEVMRALRAKHGKVSPTFYSYLYYGDVTASLAP